MPVGVVVFDPTSSEATGSWVVLAADLLPWGCVGVSSFPTPEKKGCLRGLHTEPYLYRLKEDTYDLVVSLCTCKTTLCWPGVYVHSTYSALC